MILYPFTVACDECGGCSGFWCHHGNDVHWGDILIINEREL